MPPFLFTCLASGLGALVVGALFWRSGSGLRDGIALGAIAGFLGSLATMIPLQYCFLDPKNHMFFKLSVLGQTITVNAVALIALLLVVVVIWAFTLAINRLRHRWLARGGAIWRADTAPGTFVGYDISPWIFLAPTVVGLAIFTYYPAAQKLLFGYTISATRGHEYGIHMFG